MIFLFGCHRARNGSGGEKSMSRKSMHAIMRRSLWLALFAGAMFEVSQMIPPHGIAKAVSLVASAVWGS